MTGVSLTSKFVGAWQMAVRLKVPPRARARMMLQRL
jgi:hypothetical protein